MTIVDVVSIQSGRNEDKCVEGATGIVSLLEVSYAYITLKDCADGDGFTMRLECGETGFTWRDRDGAVDKTLELTRSEIGDDLEETIVTVYDSLRVGDRVAVLYQRSHANRIRQSKGVVDRVMIMI